MKPWGVEIVKAWSKERKAIRKMKTLKFNNSNNYDCNLIN